MKYAKANRQANRMPHNKSKSVKLLHKKYYNKQIRKAKGNSLIIESLQDLKKLYTK